MTEPAFYFVLALALIVATKSWDYALARHERIKEERRTCSHSWERREYAGIPHWVCPRCGSQTHKEP